MKKNTKHITSIGGQAVIEGVMMRGPKNAVLAVRTPDNNIVVEPIKTKNLRQKYKVLGLPVIRGVIGFGESMIFGYKTLMRSAELAGQEESTQPSKFEKWMAKNLKINVFDLAMYISVLVGAALALGLFILIPTYTTKLINDYLFEMSDFTKTLVAGLIKITIFILYLFLVSLLKDIRRVFMYHGAEHKTIHCYENEKELTVENVKTFSTRHPRCGTSFIFVVLIVSIIVMSFFKWDSIPLRILINLCLLPIIAGVTFEINRLVGKYNNWFTRILSAPGRGLQAFTTREPDDSQIEVAIAAFNAVKTENKDEDKW